MTDRYAVIGNPIAHSKSPVIHAAFAQQTGQDISYERVLAPLDGFAATVKRLRDEGYKGCNVTVPFKFEAYELCTTHSKQAALAGAVNTMIFAESGRIHGHNTDGDGLINDITQNLSRAIRGARVLLLGAGGAAQGVFQLLLTEQPQLLVVANRTLEKAERIVNKASDKSGQGMASTFDGLKDFQFDIIINATSTGLSNTALPIPESIFSQGCLAYDMMYGRETPFMRIAREQGAQVADGLGMLVEQAAEAFTIWRGVRPDTAPVLELMRRS